MKSGYDNQPKIADPHCSSPEGVAERQRTSMVSTHEQHSNPQWDVCSGQRAFCELSLLEGDQHAAAEYLRTLGYEVTANDLSRWASYGSGPEHCRSGAVLIFSEDALLKWASTIERLVPQRHNS